jgi:Polymerase beta, Nucleotidyltransferase
MSVPTPPLDLHGITELLSSKLWNVTGVEAIVLGGSHARGNARPDSDIDIAMLYRDSRPLDIDRIRAIANEVNDTPDPVVVEIGGWGPWVNGGAWLTIGGQRVDVLYRSIDAYERVIEQAKLGKAEHDWLQQPPYGFPSVSYLGEIEIGKVLLDPRDVVHDLREQIRPYPPALKHSLISGFIWGAEFTVENTRKPAERNDAYAALGGITRAGAMLTFAVFALNEQYYTTDKGALDLAANFATAPVHFATRMHDAIREPHYTAAVEQMSELIAETKALWQR